MILRVFSANVSVIAYSVSSMCISVRFSLFRSIKYVEGSSKCNKDDNYDNSQYAVLFPGLFLLNDSPVQFPIGGWSVLMRSVYVICDQVNIFALLIDH